MKRQLLQFALACCTVVSFVAISEGCGLQSEGQRCSKLNDDVNNVSNDCETGLKCVSKNVLGTNSDICCRDDGTQSTEAACIPGRLNGGSSTTGTTGAGTTTGTTTTATTGAGGNGGMGGAGGGM